MRVGEIITQFDCLAIMDLGLIQLAFPRQGVAEAGMKKSDAQIVMRFTIVRPDVESFLIM